MGLDTLESKRFKYQYAKKNEKNLLVSVNYLMSTLPNIFNFIFDLYFF